MIDSPNITSRLTTRKLLILSIEGVLCTEKFLDEDDKKLVLLLHPRKELEIFLEKIFSIYDVAIWGSGSHKRVVQNISFIMTRDQISKLKFCFSDIQAKKIESHKKNLSFKCLSTIWRSFPCYDQSNTLLIEPFAYKTVQNPFWTALYPQAFLIEAQENIFLMKILYPVLLDISSATHVRLYLRQNSPKWSSDHYYRFLHSPLFRDLIRQKLIKPFEDDILDVTYNDLLRIKTSELTYIQKAVIQKYEMEKDIAEDDLRSVGKEMKFSKYSTCPLDHIRDYMNMILKQHSSIIGKSLLECTKYADIDDATRTCTNSHCQMCPKYLRI